MKSKWLLPLTVFGLGGLGVLVLSDRGIDAMQALASRIGEAPQRFREWNDAAQRELDRIQATLDDLTEGLEVAQ